MRGRRNSLRMVCVGALQTDDGVTPVYIACAQGHREVAELLLDRGAVVNQARV
jgi:ankyrin repeat protein